MSEGNHDECNSLYRLNFYVFLNTGQLRLGNLLVLILARFWPLLIAVVLSCLIFEVIARKAKTRHLQNESEGSAKSNSSSGLISSTRLSGSSL